MRFADRGAQYKLTKAAFIWEAGSISTTTLHLAQNAFFRIRF
jgi:hypothetical protein